MKVIQVTIEAHEGNGGVFTSVRHFCRALDSWCESQVLDFNTAARDQKAESTVSISNNFAGKKFGWIDRREQARLAAKLHGADFVIIHVPYRFHAGHVADWCTRHAVPYAFVPHGAFDPYVFTYRAWQKKAWLSWIGKRVIARAAFVIYATRGEAEKASRVLPESRDLVLSWPTPLPKKIDRAGTREQVRKQYKIPSDHRILLYLGRLNPMKRPLETAEAFRAVAPKDWTLVMAGPDDGVTRAELKEDDRIKPIGAIFGDDKDRLFAASDALVLFSHRENFGFAVTEALSHALPVLVSNELDLAPEIREGGFGWVADARDARGRGDGIRAIVSAPSEDLLKRGELGQAWVANALSEERFATALRESIERVVAQKPPRVLC